MQISYLDILARYSLFQFLFLHKNQNISFLYPNQNDLLYEIDSLSQKKKKNKKKKKIQWRKKIRNAIYFMRLEPCIPKIWTNTFKFIENMYRKKLATYYKL